MGRRILKVERGNQGNAGIGQGLFANTTSPNSSSNLFGSENTNRTVPQSDPRVPRNAETRMNAEPILPTGPIRRSSPNVNPLTSLFGQENRRT